MDNSTLQRGEWKNTVYAYAEFSWLIALFHADEESDTEKNLNFYYLYVKLDAWNNAMINEFLNSKLHFLY